MGFYEDDRIRRKNIQWEVQEVMLGCMNCETEVKFYKNDTKPVADQPCPECKKKALVEID
jgi:hypothetical protein